jgi:hypothetical protein
MLPDFIIDQIKRRENQDKRIEIQPTLEIPFEPLPKNKDEETPYEVVIVQIT